MFVIYLVLSLLSNVSGYSSGAPSLVCKDMNPGHGVEARPAESNPYHITVDKSKVAPGENVMVTLGGDTFKGVLLQARRPGGDTALGRFVDGDNYQLISCGGENNTVTHDGSALKQNVTLTWIPDENDEGPVVFRATFLASYTVFWSGVESEKELLVESKVQNGPISKMEELSSRCGTYFTCFGVRCEEPPYGDCKILSAYERSKDGTFEVQLAAKSDGYVAVGFSEDDRMGDDAVVECVKEGNEIKAYSSYNLPNTKDNRRFGENGISDVTGSHIDGVLFCSFRLSSVLQVSDDRQYDLNAEPVHVMVAAGYATQDGLGYHTAGRGASATKQPLQ